MTKKVLLPKSNGLMLMPVALILLLLLMAPIPAYSEQVTDCDRLAALPDDLDRPGDVPGVKFADLDAEQAEQACRAALSSNPGNTRVQFELGRALERKKRVEEAKQWYENAANGGYQAAMISRAVVAMQEQDRNAAASWLDKARPRGGNRFGSAANDLGRLYVNDKAGPANYEAAMQWFKIAYSAGFRAAAGWIGWQYVFGRGVAVDYTAAKDWLEKGAAADSVVAYDQLGEMYLYARGVASNYDTAQMWFNKSNPRAQPYGEPASFLGAHLTQAGRVVTRTVGTGDNSHLQDEYTYRITTFHVHSTPASFIVTEQLEDATYNKSRDLIDQHIFQKNSRMLTSAPLAELDPRVEVKEVSVSNPVSGYPAAFYQIEVRCSANACLDFQSVDRFSIIKGEKDNAINDTNKNEQSIATYLRFATREDAVRAANAMSDLIKMGGGKASKY